MDYHEAKAIIRKKLEKLGIKFEKDSHRLEGKYFYLDISGGSYAWKTNYDMALVTISTNEYKPNSYKKFRRHLRHFDIIKGDYTKLQAKIIEVIKKDKEFTKETKEQKHSENQEFNRVLKLFKKYNPKEINSDYRHFKLKYNNLDITVGTDYAKEIEINFTGDYKDLIKLLNKITGGKK